VAQYKQYKNEKERRQAFLMEEIRKNKELLDKMIIEKVLNEPFNGIGLMTIDVIISDNVRLKT
jgi:hypothetical protein